MDEKKYESDIHIDSKVELEGFRPAKFVPKVTITKTGKIRKPYPPRPSIIKMKSRLEELEAELVSEKTTRKALERALLGPSSRTVVPQAKKEGLVFL